MIRHVVWDWNGTLFDDFHIVVEAVNAGIVPFGLDRIDEDGYRTHYVRPVKLFYERLAGRPITESEWLELDRRFHDAYRRLLPEAGLSTDARQALDAVREVPAEQSLLSMFPHHELLPLVDRLGVASYFSRIDGLQGEPGARKAGFLERHLQELILHEDPHTVLLIGDATDDAVAAAHVGAEAVLVDNGSHHRDELEAMGVPVASNLLEALQLGGLA
ncbi:MAG: HAD hydrolase-like protein [Acidimicrobiia bacterium]|nr:HAD hydrolase-like protein [Acidimicrobiia bacterium]